jgi:hypothetical protein
MGAGASAVNQWPDMIDKSTAQRLLGDGFDDFWFESEATNGIITKDDFIKICSVCQS